MDPTPRQVGRLALRQEGDMWNAYYAMPDTMVGAVFMGGIRMAIVTRSRKRKNAFMNLMRGAIADIVEAKTGQRPTFPTGAQRAPEHERGGNA